MNSMPNHAKGEIMSSYLVSETGADETGKRIEKYPTSSQGDSQTFSKIQSSSLCNRKSWILTATLLAIRYKELISNESLSEEEWEEIYNLYAESYDNELLLNLIGKVEKAIEESAVSTPTSDQVSNREENPSLFNSQDLMLRAVLLASQYKELISNESLSEKEWEEIYSIYTESYKNDLLLSLLSEAEKQVKGINTKFLW